MKRKHLKSFTILLTLALAFCQVKANASANTAESIAENVTENPVESTVEGTAESTVENAPESTTENAAESTVESTVESAAENTTESAPEKAEESIPEIAAENAPENITVPTASNELISVELPVIEERDPFNFFIDPLHILYSTFSNSGGDITVEEDASLLFYNRNENGDTLSSRSDRLEIINKSTVPLEVTITAKVEKTDGITVVQDKEFEDRGSCDLYLAIVDNKGNEQPLSGDGEVSITIYLDQVPLDAYAYVLNEDTGEYQYVCQSEDMAFDTYSFGLIGACNEKGDWGSIRGRLHGTISWNVEPVVSEESGAGGELDKKPDENPEDIPGSSASADDVPDKDGQNSGGPAADGGENSTEDVAGDTEGRAPENDRPDEKGTTEESGSDTGSSGVGEADGDTVPDKDGQNEYSRNEDDQNEAKQTASGDENSTEDAAGNTDSLISESDVSGGGEATIGRGSGSVSGDDKEEVPDDDGSTDESSVNEKAKGESVAPQESKNPDEMTGGTGTLESQAINVTHSG